MLIWNSGISVLLVLGHGLTLAQVFQGAWVNVSLLWEFLFSLPWLSQNCLYNHDLSIFSVTLWSALVGRNLGRVAGHFFWWPSALKAAGIFQQSYSFLPSFLFLNNWYSLCVCTTSVELCMWKRGGVFLCTHIHTHTYPDLNYASGRIYSPLWAQLIS